MVDRDKTHIRRFYNRPSGTKWVRILYCPKDNPDDVGSMFSPASKFPMDQFIDSLTRGMWPEGMVIELSLTALTREEERKRVIKKVKYVVPKRDRQWMLKTGMEEDHRKFMDKVGGRE